MLSGGCPGKSRWCVVLQRIWFQLSARVRRRLIRPAPWSRLPGSLAEAGAFFHGKRTNGASATYRDADVVSDRLGWMCGDLEAELGGRKMAGTFDVPVESARARSARYARVISVVHDWSTKRDRRRRKPPPTWSG